MSSRRFWIVIPAAAVTAAIIAQTRAPAQSAKGGKQAVAVIDIVKVFNSYQQTKDLNAAFDRHRSNLKAEADKRNEVLTAKKEALQACQPNHPDYKNLFAETSRLESDLKTWLQLEEQEVMRKHKHWLQKTYENISDMAATVATKRGYDLVLTYDEFNASDIPDSSTLRQRIVLRTVIYASAPIDITDEVLNTLNLNYKTSGGVKITF
jgi:Skp family chaperone for outer membrane proteins